MLQIENLSAGYGGREVLSGLSCVLERGRIHALIGPSGCGKSTLLKVLCGIHRNYSGDMFFDGRPLNGTAGGAVSIGYVPQNYGLLAWKTIRDNIFLPLKITGLNQATRSGMDDSGYAGRVIASLGLAEVLERYPREVSGGQQQRAALARAFLLRPDLLLMDEPFSALDAFTAEKSQELFLSLWRDFRVTTLFITHNMREAALLGQRILLLPGGLPGRVLGQENSVLSLDNPAFGMESPFGAEEARGRLVAEMAAIFHGRERASGSVGEGA